MKVFVLLLAVAIAHGAILPKEEGLRVRKPLVGGTPENPIITWQDVPVTYDPKIVGGTEATPHEFPWQVNIIMDGSYICGGSVVKPNWVLTAAHCCDGFSSFRITAGDHNRNTNEGTEQVRITSNQHIHPNWTASTLANDLCLLQVDTFVVDTYVDLAPSLDPADAGDHTGETVTVTGWGKTSDSGSASNLLNKVDVPVISNSVCSQSYNIINAGHICISTANGKGSCNGDSGGPMISQDRTHLYGVVSFGSSLGCAIGFPSGFSRVSHFRGWIDGIIGA